MRAVFGLGMGLTSAPATESIMGSLPPGKAGVGSAVNDTTRQTGGALGRRRARQHLRPSLPRLGGGHPPDCRPVCRRRIQDSIGNALIVAQRLPAEQQRLVIAAADHAYISSIRVAFAVAGSDPQSPRSCRGAGSRPGRRTKR